MRFLLGLVVSVAAVALAVGWGASSRAAESHVLGAGIRSGSWATPAELAWLEKLGAWNTRLLRGLRSAALVETTPQLAQKLLNRDGQTMVLHQRALRPAGSCAADLQRNVGPAPSERLQRALDTFGQACTYLERFHSAITLAIDGQHGSQMLQAQQEATRAAAILLRADQLLPPGEVRPLPVIAGVAVESRVEPLFGRIASALAGKQVEVRCWSSSDWQRLMREEGTYTQGRLRPDTLGFAGIGADRINLAPSVCNGLVQIAYKQPRPTDAAGRLALAAAVVTLTHEPRHSSGIADEAVAECQAIQLANGTAVKLGATPAYAASLVQEYWRHYGEELSAYRSTECRPGGKLDLGNASSIW